MTQRYEDVESSAQLLSKENASSSEESDYNDLVGSNWFTQRMPQRRRRIWQCLSSISIPTRLSIQNLNTRYLTFAVIVSLIVTAFIFNPYAPSTSSQHQNEIEVSPTPRPALPSIPRPNKANYTTYERPNPKPDEKFCTTWPVDEEGNYEFGTEERVNNVKLDSLAPAGGWKKPEGIRIVAMVFYGRKRYVDILDCYLRKNLASNGGYLDEVWFMAHTQDEDDTAWVEGLVLEEPDYKIIGQHECENEKYSCLWNFATADNTIYIKIDDDIIFIHPDAIPQLVHTRLAVPHPYAISANLVNSPMSGMEQYHFGAIHAFVPDPRDNVTRPAAETWRPSKLGTFPQDKLQELKEMSSDDIMYPENPYRGHPFLLISEDRSDLLQTSMGRYDQAPGGDFIAFSPPWKSWAMAAQQHYSLLHNLETNQMHRYFFGQPAAYGADAKGPDLNKTTTHITATTNNNSTTSSSHPAVPPRGPGGEQIYDTSYRRYNLNFCAVWGADVAAQLPIADDDEADMTDTIPKRLGRPFAIDTRAVVAHFSFWTQSEGMARTDLLDRWRAFANEAVCPSVSASASGGDGDGGMRKKPWDLRCPGF
ncbi:hypothetical protein F5X99DRAFT_431737 [Biscogniauxia marginata]|nr:hypothetical protein F5X99DRAFT_431737 [Biscogniauxia marginata]